MKLYRYALKSRKKRNTHRRENNYRQHPFKNFNTVKKKLIALQAIFRRKSILDFKKKVSKRRAFSVLLVLIGIGTKYKLLIICTPFY